MTIAEALRLAVQSIDRLDAQYLLADLLKTSRAALLAHAERTLTVGDAAEFLRRVRARTAGQPVAYILGKREFYGREFVVGAAVLIPRPETETLVEQALARRPAHGDGATVLDLGTGSGALAVTLAAERPGLRVTATDRSPAALAVARDNAARLSAKVECIESDWYAALAGRRFDLIVANPPYVTAADRHLAEGDLRFEPRMALTDGSADGLASLTTIIAGAPERLNPGGWLLLEHGYDQADRCRDLLLKAGFTHLILQQDLSGIPRVAGGQVGEV